MKIRQDFVTNSSSASFVLAQKGEFTEQQKAAIMQTVERHLFGDVILTPDMSEEKISSIIHEDYTLEAHESEIREALKEGKNIRMGSVDFDCDSYDLGDLCSDVWKSLFGKGNFDGISTDLSY